ncbi:hypothetical protein NQ317_000316 [Molorchus minor]|uniref:Integrase zinc-binding domain-containing protein n=1 Tax=Molorchus minor TaxID=1323400 RepID=A0ABQ9JA38_9CUCU|nr:hypothetical protein NQ317_000316 [Molorchus minor]
MGKVKSCPLSTVNSFLSIQTTSLDVTLKKFWELESVPNKPLMSSEDSLCENIYKASHRRDVTGRFTVSLPFKDTEPSFSDSRLLALRRFYSLERRLLKNPSLYKEYCAFYGGLPTLTYVDDIVGTCDSISEGEELKKELICLLRSGGFELRKWATNSPSLLSDIPVENCLTDSLSFDKDNSDTFSFDVSPLDRPCTKRTILSELARIFDPLGFLTPISFFAKYLIQLLWSLGLEWDEAPPPHVLNLWFRYKSELPLISKISIPRQVVPDNFLECELHGFSDSSEKGYAAVTDWPAVNSTPVVTKEEEKTALTTLFVALDCIDSMLDKFSSLAKIQRILAYVLRFIYNSKHSSEKLLSPFTHLDLHQALLILCLQRKYFSLENAKPLSKGFRKLKPFLGEDGILRVGGRLYFSGLSYDHKFPALLPRNHRLTELIIEKVHCQNLHVGLQTLQFLLSQKFWILSPRRAIRHVLSKCLKCFKAKPTQTIQTPLMGDLPSQRVNQLKPFQCVGWRMARVLKTHPGHDGIIRTVTLKTKEGILQRPVVKVCPLPCQ